MVGFEYESKFQSLGFQHVCGIDEAGRGPLAGPVFAAAVILQENIEIEGLDDSKKLSEKKREALFDEITTKAGSFSIAYADHQEIDQMNILNATFLAMCRAVKGLDQKADFALVDGNRKPKGLPIPCETIIKGDGISASIAAASILAKVSRDRFMKEADRVYPEYRFAKHKGYPTALHRELVNEYGPCPLHRLTFLKRVLK